MITLFSDSDLPIKGWFQCCIMCGQVTAKTLFFKNVICKKGKNIEIRAHMCHGCEMGICKHIFFDEYVMICNEEIKRIGY